MALEFQMIRRFVRDLFIAVGVLVLTLIGGCVYFHSRSPRFSGASPEVVEVRMYSLSGTAYQSSITNREACDTLLREFRQAHGVFFRHRPSGEMTFRFANGKTDTVQVAFGSPQGYCYFYLRGTFQLEGESFYRALKNAGLDVSNIHN
jgi:hypothetical protein